MKYRRGVLLLIIAGFLLPLASAQKFQEPTREELAMTSDPKAPGASAVYLYREISDDEGNYTSSAYARIKILTKDGMQLGQVEIPYDPATNGEPIVEARTIHSNGTVIRLPASAAHSLEIKRGPYRGNLAIFHMPSVEIGSILEYRWTVPHTDAGISSEHTGASHFSGGVSGTLTTTVSAIPFPAWEVQLPYFVHKEHFYFNRLAAVADLAETTVRSTPFSQHLPAGSHVVDWHNGGYTLDLSDVPAFRAEADEPPEQSLAYRVEFYFARYLTPETFWSLSGKPWWESITHNLAANSDMRGAVASLIANASTPEQKARLIYAQVQRLRNTDFLPANSPENKAPSASKAASETWKDESGTSDDLALLYVSLARAAGLDVRAAAVVDRRRRLFDRNYLSMSQFTDFIAVLRLDSKEIYLDPGQKLCPFGELAWQHASSESYIEDAAAPSLTPMVSAKDAITARVADLTIDAAGGVTGTVHLVMNGPAALDLRQLKLTNVAGAVEQQVNESLRRVIPATLSVQLNGIQGIETSDGFVQVTARVSGTLGSVDGERIVLPAFLFSSSALPQFTSEETREAPIDMRYPEQVMDEVIYHLPAGYSVEGAPDSMQLPWPDHANLTVKVSSTAISIDVKHIFARGFDLLDAKEYPALRDYYGKLADKDRQQITLSASAKK